MLVLTRTQDESIVIDGRIRVTILSVRGNHVRLGIEAPEDVRVDREEVHSRILAAGFATSGAFEAVCAR